MPRSSTATTAPYSRRTPACWGRSGSNAALAVAPAADHDLALVTDTSPFNAPIPPAEHRRATYIEPILIGEVRYGLQTSDGRLRFPSWRGLRSDKTWRRSDEDRRRAGIPARQGALEKLERARRRQAEEDAKRNLPVDLALLVVGLLVLFIGVAIVMRTPDAHWPTGPAPLQPITTTTTPPGAGCSEYTMPDGSCRQCPPSWGDDCRGGTHITTPTRPTKRRPATRAQRPGRGPALRGRVQRRAGPDRPDWCVSPTPPTPTTTEPFPTQLLCDAIRPKPPNCPGIVV